MFHWKRHFIIILFVLYNVIYNEEQSIEQKIIKQKFLINFFLEKYNKQSVKKKKKKKRFFIYFYSVFKLVVEFAAVPLDVTLLLSIDFELLMLPSLLLLLF